MSIDLPAPPHSALQITADQHSWSDTQRHALRELGLEAAGDAELDLLFHHAHRSGLDPFARQIYLIARSEGGRRRWTVQTGIDGFRVIARRAADRAGEDYEYEDTLWCSPDGVWSDVWLSGSAPAAAKVTVLRNGRRFSAAATFAEYAATRRDGEHVVLSGQWISKPAVMIAKCAEALALRKAFPQDLAGLYTSEEMEQAANPPRPATTVPGEQPPALDPDWDSLAAQCATIADCRGLYRRAARQHAPDRIASVLLERARVLSQGGSPQVGEGRDGDPSGTAGTTTADTPVLPAALPTAVAAGTPAACHD